MLSLHTLARRHQIVLWLRHRVKDVEQSQLEPYLSCWVSLQELNLHDLVKIKLFFLYLSNEQPVVISYHHHEYMHQTVIFDLHTLESVLLNHPPYGDISERIHLQHRNDLDQNMHP